MIVISKYVVSKGYSGITIFSFVFLKSFALKENKTIVNHEKIHLRQQMELLIFPFYVIYTIEFLRLILYNCWRLVYKNLSFEREAYRSEHDMLYIKSRKFWRFLKYLRTDAI